MATVTMTGKEYEDMLNMKARYEELMFFMVGARFPKISDKDESDKWHIQETGNFLGECPSWLKRDVKAAVTNYVNLLSERQFKHLVEQDWLYYDAHAGEFCGYERNQSIIYLYDDPEFKARWDEVVKEVNADE